MLADSLSGAPNTSTNIAFSAPRGSGSVSVIESLDTSPKQTTGIRITTIHSVKGETVDAIMLVSSPSKKGLAVDGHWTEWLKDPSSEAARFAYVASSRPKHLLVWAVPEEKNRDYSRLETLGFVAQKIGDRASSGKTGAGP